MLHRQLSGKYVPVSTFVRVIFGPFSAGFWSRFFVRKCTVFIQMIIDSEMRARCEFQLETINMFNRQLFVLATARSFTFLPTGEVSTTINQIIKVS